MGLRLRRRVKVPVFARKFLGLGYGARWTVGCRLCAIEKSEILTHMTYSLNSLKRGKYRGLSRGLL